MPLLRSLRPLAVAVVFLSVARGGEFDVIINEIHYNPYLEGSEGSLEFIELRNLGPAAVDLSGWRFTNGVTFLFPEGARLEGFGHLVVSPDPTAAREFYDLEVVFGPYAGQLSNGGEIVELRNRRGAPRHRVHYLDEEPWPSRADGGGPSIEYTRSDDRTDIAQRWKSSRLLHGTPGRENSRLVRPRRVIPLETAPLIEITDDWSTFRGRDEPSAEELAWTRPEFDDADWEILPGGFGFDDADPFPLGTEISDMEENYSSFYLRGAFELSGEDVASILAGEGSLEVEVAYDDGFVAHVNGIEIGRRNIGAPGIPVPHDAVASSNEREQVSLGLDAFTARGLREGTNVLAIQGHNRRRSNGDFYIGAAASITRVRVAEGEDRGSAYVGGILNELAARDGDAGNFIELFNATSGDLDLSDASILNDEAVTIPLPPAVVLAPGERRLLAGDELGFVLPPRGSTYLLVASDGRTILDRLEVDALPPGASFGRFPDGDGDAFVFTTPGPGEENALELETPVIIHEISFHPPFVPSGEDCPADCSDLHQWIELHNRSAESVDLTGWSLSSAVRFDFPDGLEIPAGGFVVVCDDVDAFAALHPEVAVEIVAGEWNGRLSHDSEAIHLNDAPGNRVDRVEYGDGGPSNDEEPEDGIDDGTFAGSSWPRGADGEGGTLELVHPELDNRHGHAWRAASSPGGTPGAANSTFDAAAPPVVGRVRHSPAVPAPGEEVRVTCRLSAIRPVVRAEVQWSIDGTGDAGVVPLLDDGIDRDLRAGDGTFTAVIPGGADRQIFRFRIVVEDETGAIRDVPAPPPTLPHDDFEGPFYLYEVSGNTTPPTDAPFYRIVMTAADIEELEDRNIFSNVLLPATFIEGDRAFHLVGVRYRGENSRRLTHKAFRVAFHHDRLFEGLEDINLNAPNGGEHGDQSARELFSTQLIRRAGAPYPLTHPVTLRFPGAIEREVDTRYIYKENYDSLFLHRVLDGAADGNLYRARNPDGPGSPNGNLTFRGEDPGEYRDIYQKKSQREADDYSDIIELSRLFDLSETPDDEVFADGVETLVDAAQWAQFFALMDTASNTDGGIWNNNGEDYALYHLPEDTSHPQAGKWWLLAWDLEETFRDSNQNLFRVSVPTVRRFLTHPRFAHLYYRALRDLELGAFSRTTFRSRLGELGSMHAPGAVEDLLEAFTRYNEERLFHYETRIADRLEVGARTAAVDPEVTEIVAFGAEWRFHRGSENPAGDSLIDWTLPGYDDAGWEVGPAGFGYADGDDATPLDDMQDNYTTVFLRTLFSRPGGEVGRMLLALDYDDAYVAYLNGEEVGRSENAPEGDIAFDANAQNSHESSQGNPDLIDFIDLTDRLETLEAEGNLLAVVGINRAADSSDFSIHPALLVTPPDEGGPDLATGCGSEIFAGGTGVLLGGRADAATSRSVRAEGELAAFDLVTGGGGPYGARWSVTLPSTVDPRPITVTANDDPGGLGADVESFEVTIEPLETAPVAAGTVIDFDTTWEAAQSPYRLDSELTISAGARLVIEAGVTVLVAAESRLVVAGEIEVAGTAEQPVVFRPATCGQSWNGIRILDTGITEADPRHRLRGATFLDAAGGESAVRVESSRARFEDCRFEIPGARAITAIGSSLEITGCQFNELRGAVSLLGGDTVIESCLFESSLGGEPVILQEAGGDLSVLDCLLLRGEHDGVIAREASVEIARCIFEQIAGDAMSLTGSAGEISRVTSCIVNASGTGLSLSGSLRLEDSGYLTITGCDQGVELLANDGDGAVASLHSSIIWGNRLDVDVQTGTLEIDHSLTGGETPLPGEGNLVGDPGLVDAPAGDFALAPDSPAREAGRDGTDMGAVQDIGPPPVLFVRTDLDDNGTGDITDVILMLQFLFLGQPGPTCLDRIDADDDGDLVITDPIYALSYQFVGGTPPPPPFPDPGPDPTDDDLPCEE